MDNLDKLFEHIVDAYALKEDLIDVELVAPAREKGISISSAKAHVVEREQESARALRDAFRSGLTDAYQLHQRGIDELKLSDQIALQNSQADALIRYLVSFDLAASRTTQESPGHYIYYVSVKWGRLSDICDQLGFDLATSLAP